jgi:hypothetical protein
MNKGERCVGFCNEFITILLISFALAFLLVLLMCMTVTNATLVAHTRHVSAVHGCYQIRIRFSRGDYLDRREMK